MKDRVPTLPGRVKLTPVSGDLYDLEMADQPTELGTPLNKANLLQDATASKYGLSAADNPTPNDAFNAAFDAVPTIHLDGVWTRYGPHRYYAEPLNVSRSYLAGASVGGNALFAGGRTGGRVYSDYVDAYDTSITHTVAPSLSIARAELCGASNGNYALFFGGYNLESHYLDVVDAYDSSLTHSTPSALGEERCSLSCAKVGNYIIVAGGETTNGNISRFVDAYDSSLTRTRLVDLMYSRSGLAGTNVGSYAIFAGGTTGSSTYYPVDVYDVSLSKSTAQTLSVERHDLAGASTAHIAFFSGGVSSDGSTLSDVVDVYNTSLTRSTAQPLNIARRGLSGARLINNDYVLFAGGDAGPAGTPAQSDVIDMYTSSLTHTTTALNVARPNLASANVGGDVIFAGGGMSDEQTMVGEAELYKVAYGLSITIPSWSKYKISDVTSTEEFTQEPVEISATSTAPFTGYIKRGFSLSGII